LRIFLDQNDLTSKLRCLIGGGKSCATAADHHDICFYRLIQVYLHKKQALKASASWSMLSMGRDGIRCCANNDIQCWRACVSSSLAMTCTIEWRAARRLALVSDPGCWP
jgi:hypothetical protein